jgi:hypothetical protein
MSYTFQDGDLSTAQIDGPKRWLRPFDDDFSQVVFEQDYQQFEDDFTPLPLDTPHDTIKDAYLVSEGPLDALGGGVVKWTRTYARIPASRQRFESYSWTVPGIGTEAVYSSVSISSNSSAAGVTTLVTATSSTAGVGDSVLVSYTFTDGVTGTQYGRDVLRTCLSGTSGTTINVDLISEPGGTITYNTLKKVEPGRDPYTEEVGSVLQLDYFLPGVSAGIDSPQDIPELAPLTIYDNTGRQTASFTATTTPTLATWRSKVAAGEYVCVVRSIPRRWMGNIYERATRYVKAI